MADTDKKPARSFLDISPEELEMMVKEGKWPENAGWEGLESSTNFSKLIRSRHNPRTLGTELMKMRGILPDKVARESLMKYESVISPEERSRKLDIKQQELDIKKQKISNQTKMWEEIQDIKRDQSLTLKSINAVLRELMDIRSTLERIDRNGFNN